MATDPMPGDADEKPKLPLVFYRTAAGGEPVRDWLRSLLPADRRAIGLDVLRLQHLWPIGKPLCDHLGGSIWEARSDLSGNRIARVLFCVIGDEIVALNGFIKKTQRTLPREIDLARNRMKEYSK